MTEFSKLFFEHRKKYGDKLMVFTSIFSAHGFVVLNDLNLYGFGDNRYYQLGLNDNVCTEKLRINLFFNKNTIKKVCCGCNFTIFQLITGEIYSCGTFYKNSTKKTDVLIQKVPEIWNKFENSQVKIDNIFTGPFSLFFLKKNGDVLSYGLNCDAQLGIGGKRGKCIDQGLVILPEKILYISCAKRYTIFISVNGNIFFSGVNRYICVDNKYSGLIETPIIIDFFKGKNVVQIECGFSHSVFLTYDNKVFVSGNHKNGRLGIGSGIKEKKKTLFEKSIQCMFPKYDRMINRPINITKKIVTNPILLSKLGNEKIISIKCGPKHTVFICKKKMFVTGNNVGFKRGLRFHFITKNISLFNINVGFHTPYDIYEPIQFSFKEKKIIQTSITKGSSMYFTKNESYICVYNVHGDKIINNRLRELNANGQLLLGILVQMRTDGVRISDISEKK